SDIAVLISRFFLGVRQLTIDLMLYNASPMLQKATFNDAEHASYERQSRELRINLNMLQTERKVLMNEMSEVIDENITMSVTHVNSDQLKPQGQITYWGTMGVCILLLGGAIVLGRKRRNS
ncbi:MAG: putative ABC-class ATPase, partial [Lysobacterales bacterium]